MPSYNELKAAHAKSPAGRAEQAVKRVFPEAEIVESHNAYYELRNTSFFRTYPGYVKFQVKELTYSQLQKLAGELTMEGLTSWRFDFQLDADDPRGEEAASIEVLYNWDYREGRDEVRK